jgi:hypothetical protein
MRIEVDGLKELRKNLRSVDRQLPKGLTKIHKEIAKPVAVKGKGRVNSRTGRLAATVKPSGTQRISQVAAGQGLAYGAVNHWGGYPGSYPGNRFLTDTMREMAPETLRNYDRELTAWLEQLWVDTR